MALQHPSVVIDASVWVSWLLPQDINYVPSRTWLQPYIASGGLLVAPSLVLVEVAAAIRRRSNNSNLAKQSLNYLLQVPELRVVPLDALLVQAAGSVAADQSLRAGDAVYAALALQLVLPLVSWDQQQLQRSSAVITTYTPATFVY